MTRWECESNDSMYHKCGTGTRANGVLWCSGMGEKKRNMLKWFSHMERKKSGDTFRMLRNIQMAFHFLVKYMMRKNITTMMRPKLEYAEVIWSPHKKKYVLKLVRIQRIAIKLVPDLEKLSYEKR